MYDFVYLQGGLNELVRDFSNAIPNLERDQIREFIDVNEYGEAFLLLVGVLTEEKARISSQAFERISELGRRMELDEKIWKNLIVE